MLPLPKNHWRRFRAQYDDQATITPHIGVAAAVPVGSSVRKAKMYPAKKPFYDQERFWFISGCASLLVIVFASFAILLGMAGNLQDLAALSLDNRDFEDIRSDIFGDTLNVLASTSEYDVTVDMTQRVPVLNIPYVVLENLPDEADDPIVGLIRTRSLYEAGNQAEARQEVIANTPETNNPELRALYFISAGRIASEQDDNSAAVVFWIIASEFALDNDPVFDAIRPVTMELIYENASNLGSLEIGVAIRNMGSTDEAIIEQLENSFFTSFARVRMQISNDNTTRARASLTTINEPNPIEAEFNLLRAELQLELENMDNAQTLLDAILEDADTPRWVRDRAEELQNELE